MGSKGKIALGFIFIGRSSFYVIKKIIGAPFLIIPDELEYSVSKRIMVQYLIISSCSKFFKVG